MKKRNRTIFTLLIMALGLGLMLETTVSAAQPQTTSPRTPKLEVLVINSLVVPKAELNVIHLTNIERLRRGLPILQIDLGLMQSSQRHCQWMAHAQSLQHGNAPVAENIAMGQPNSNSAVGSWMNSSGHRANMLNPSYTRIGVSVHRAINGTLFWCQQFLH